MLCYGMAELQFIPILLGRLLGRQLARSIQTKCDYPDVKFSKFKIYNMNVSATLPFGVKLTEFAQAFADVEFEPELFQAAIYRLAINTNVLVSPE